MTLFRRRTAPAAAAVAALLAAGCAGDPFPKQPPAAASRTAPSPSAPASTPTSSPPVSTPVTTPATTKQSAPVATPPARVSALPRGDRQLLPKWRIVAYYGGAHGPALGVLGSAAPDVAFARLDREARTFDRPGHPALPAFELIATVANAGPGPDGKYRSREGDAGIQRYLDAARRHKALLVLDIQPGRADFVTEAKVLEKWLVNPDVALAIDPEWRMGPGEVPGQKIGSVQASEVNAVSSWLDALTARHHLPQKLLLVHQFTTNMVKNKGAVAVRKNLAIMFNMDGFGGRDAKLAKYRMLALDKRFALGMKLFYKQDIDRFAATDLLGLKPAPMIVEYQ
jgi:hypothetical protein